MAPFSLTELDGVQPAGTYDLDTEEEAIEGNEHTVFVRVSTVLHVHSHGSTCYVTINPAGLEAALKRDVENFPAEASNPPPPHGDPGHA